ncbi:hypothetical protein GCM10010329_32270 [Streptomyces spiroverticillatus]|uniref:Uncharacterized protein n=1 Tax=Streptomyces finlayi TaxID=67296 RepID=A0A918WWM2_9ACTN|nr:hypothetical protein [Streptomyces finlayi]GHA07146.1 hypothetical protein GCM10010329_32270 [Streptomyces spiroverticillatus]GHC90573.1 hypothetical protein GCM10010334_24680 [Streptomyces finlayi]
MVTELELFADYHQIHVQDEESEDDLGEAWTDRTVADGIAVADGLIGIGTAVNVTVAVEVHVLTEEPADDIDAYDHVVEAGLDAPSGQLVVLGCSDYFDDAARFDVPEGWIRVRAARRNLAAAVAADIESGRSPATMEQIRLQIWPAPHAAPRVLRRWERAGV